VRFLSQIAFLLLAVPAMPLAAQAATPAPAPTPGPAPASLLAGLPTPTLSIYGIIDTYLGYTSSTGNPGHGSILTMDPGGYSANRLGFLGSEAIGGNAKVNFTAEDGFMSDTGAEATTGVIFNRQCWIGFSGDFGECRFGRQNTVQQTQLGNTDPFNGATYASFFNNYTGYFSRSDNVLMYKTNNLNGFVLQAQFAPGEQATVHNGLNYYGASVEYRHGGLYLLSNFEQQKSVNATANVSSNFEAATYDFGKAKVYAAFYRGNNVWSNLTGTAIAATAYAPAIPANHGGKFYNGYELSAIGHVTGKLSLGGGYGWTKDMSGTHYDANEISAIATLDVTKKLMFYSTVAKMSNEGKAAFLLAAAGPLNSATKNMPLPGQNEVGVQVGVRYLFGGNLL